MTDKGPLWRVIVCQACKLQHAPGQITPGRQTGHYLPDRQRSAQQLILPQEDPQLSEYNK